MSTTCTLCAVTVKGLEKDSGDDLGRELIM